MPQTQAAAIMRTLSLLARIVAAHFSQPEDALRFARLCEIEAGAQAGEDAPTVEHNKEAFARDPWRGWR